MPSLYEHAGGEEKLHRLEDVFYSSVLTDPLLQPLFGQGRPSHVDHLTAFTAESFGGPPKFTEELGFAHLIDVHRGLRITEEQTRRSSSCTWRHWTPRACRMTSRSDEPFAEHVEFGSRVAMQNSHAGTDAELHPLPRTCHAGPGTVIGRRRLLDVWPDLRPPLDVDHVLGHRMAGNWVQVHDKA